MTTTRRTFLLGSAAAGAAASACGVFAPAIARAQAYKSEYKLSVVGNRPIPLSVGAFRWAELITERSQGRINVKVYPGSSLVGGDQTREMVAMRQGTIDLLVSSTINLSVAIKEMNLFSLPFLMPDHAAYDSIINGVPGQMLFKLLEARDSVPLAWGENGFRELSNSKRPVRTPADMRGLKIRYAAGPIFAEIFTALGANPTQMSFADLQPALTTGAVDGQENPINLFLAFKMDQLAQKHLTIWNYCADAGIFHLSKPVWESFAPADRDIVRLAAFQAANEQLAEARKGLGQGGDDSSLRELRARGVEVVALSAAEKAVFRQATRPVYDKWAQQIGASLVRAAETAVAQQRKS